MKIDERTKRGLISLAKAGGLVLLMVAGFFIFRSADASGEKGGLRPLSSGEMGSRVFLGSAQEPGRGVAESGNLNNIEGLDGSTRPAGRPGPHGSSLDRRSAGAEAGAVKELLVVYILGAVKSPGVYRVPPGTRLADVLKAAGGATRDGDLARVNLAMRLADEDMIYIPERQAEEGCDGESRPRMGSRRREPVVTPTASPQIMSAGQAAFSLPVKRPYPSGGAAQLTTGFSTRSREPFIVASPGSSGPGDQAVARCIKASVGEGGQRDTRHADPGCADARRADTYGRILERNIGGPRNVILEPVRKDGVSKGPMRPLNINRARIEDLMQLPGIGRKRAEKIVLYRDAVGGFKTLDDLLEIPGFGEGIVRRLDGLVAF